MLDRVLRWWVRRRGGISRRGTAFCLRRSWSVVFFLCLVSLLLFQWMLSLPPPVYSSPPAFASCSSAAATSLDDFPYHTSKGDDDDAAVCTSACGGLCFPRARELCISHDAVTACSGGRSLPATLRFAGKDRFWRRNVPIQPGVCAHGKQKQKEGGAVWIRGTQMVGDMKMMPNGRGIGPSPHHEAEKLIPAILLSHFYGLNGSSLYWFTDAEPAVTSVWSMGLIAAFADDLNVKFSSVPDPGRPPICFEDAVLFSGVTNAGYVPNTASNDWLRSKVLLHCKVKARAANRPVKDVVIVNRLNSSREIANADEVEGVLERELGVPAKRLTSGVGDFCHQVRVAAEADVVVTPHGSHNVNLLFARPGSIVLEAFPLLYYLDWFRNYVHSARLDYHELFGTWPGGMPARMTLYSLIFGWKGCFSARWCMNYAKSQHVHVDVYQLERLLALYR